VSLAGNVSPAEFMVVLQSSPVMPGGQAAARSPAARMGAKRRRRENLGGRIPEV